MREKILKKTAVAGFLQRLMDTARTVAPVRVPGGFYRLAPVTRPEDVALDCTIAYYSAKAYLLPPKETLLRFGESDGKPVVEPVLDQEDLILFGLHPCDVNAVRTCDAVFEKDEKDQNYLERRKHITIIGMDCLKPCDEYSFCHDMGTNTVPPDGYDLFLTDIGDAYLVRVATERGAALLGNVDNPTDAQRAALAKAEQAKPSNFKKRIECDVAELPKLLDSSYDSLVWSAVSKRCYSCGSCVLVCPTCYCFNVEDTLDLNLKEGERRRTWDGCMLGEFAEVAGGENFRRDPASRLRHRLYRKGKLIREMFDRPGCVGCGRCERGCTSKISITATYNQLKGGA